MANSLWRNKRILYRLTTRVNIYNMWELGGRKIMVISLVYKNQGRQVIDLIFMGRLTLERSQIQEQSELVLTTVT